MLTAIKMFSRTWYILHCLFTYLLSYLLVFHTFYLLTLRFLTTVLHFSNLNLAYCNVMYWVHFCLSWNRDVSNIGLFCYFYAKLYIVWNCLMSHYHQQCGCCSFLYIVDIFTLQVFSKKVLFRLRVWISSSLSQK